MRNNTNVCQLNEPQGSFSAIPIGCIILILAIGVMDYFLIDTVEGIGTLEWLRNVFGVLSGNVTPLDHIAWVYLVIIITLFIVGVIAVRWWKSLLCALLIPIALGIGYALLGMSFGEPVMFREIFINPVLFSLPYIIPSLISAIAVSVLLSQKEGVWTEKLVSRLT